MASDNGIRQILKLHAEPPPAAAAAAPVEVIPAVDINQNRELTSSAVGDNSSIQQPTCLSFTQKVCAIFGAVVCFYLCLNSVSFFVSTLHFCNTYTRN
jgi:hypothetical protein